MQLDPSAPSLACALPCYEPLYSSASRLSAGNHEETSMRIRKHVVVPSLLLAAALTLSACGSSSTSAAAPSADASSATSAVPVSSASASDTGDAMQQLVAFDKLGKKLPKKLKIAYLAECVSANSYCQARLTGIQKAADAYGFTFKTYDPNFTPDTQLREVQDAIAVGYDGYIFMPVNGTEGCSAFRLLKATGKPIANGNSPMCGNADYTAGTVGFVGQQTTQDFTTWADKIFDACTAKCNVIAAGGFIGSDLYTRWEDGITAALKTHPNVKVVINQPGSFDASKTLALVSAGLTAHPDVSIVIVHDPDQTKGAASAITSAGKKLGTDIKLYPFTANKYAVSQIVAGNWAGAYAVPPIEESYYSAVALMRSLIDGKTTTGWAKLSETPRVADGPGQAFLDSSDAAKYDPGF
jgi:ABC-type sugar transport system substrate-binding protein